METATLDVQETATIVAPAEEVWALLTSPTDIVACLPGAEITDVADDGNLKGALLVQLGPTKVRFTGTVEPEFDDTSKTGKLTARGGDARGRTKANAITTFALEANGNDDSELRVDAHVEVAGGLAPFVRTGGKHLVTRMLGEFCDNVAEAVGPTRAPAEPRRESLQTPRTAPISGFKLLLQTIGDVLRAAFNRIFRRSRDGDGTRKDQG